MTTLPVLDETDWRKRCCEDCGFWFAQVNVQNIREQIGVCRRMPPGVNAHRNQVGALAVVCMYPQLPPNYPACAEFEKREQAPAGADSQGGAPGRPG